MAEVFLLLRPVGVLGLIALGLLTLRALADLPTMIWLRPRLAGLVVSAIMAATFIFAALLSVALAEPSAVRSAFWLPLLAACSLGVLASREAADYLAFRCDRPRQAVSQGQVGASAKPGDLTPDAPADAETAQTADATSGGKDPMEAARLLAELTGEGALAYRGHIYRQGAVQARMDFVKVDEQPRPWVARWRSAGHHDRAQPPSAAD